MRAQPRRAVVGDGTTARTRARGRWRRWRWPLALASLVAIVAVAAALPQPVTSSVALAPDNPAGTGARAVAQILGRQGVEIRYVRTSGEAVQAAVAGSTLLVTGSALLGDDQVEAIAATEADLVLLDPDAYLLDAVTTAGEVADVAPAAGSSVRQAECADDDAATAGSIRTGGAGYLARTPDAVVCFPAVAGGAGAYLAVDDGARRVVALGDRSILTNDALTAEGNAALALRVLGRHEALTWYVPSSTDFGTEAAGPGTSDLLPPWAPVVGLQLLLVAAVAAVWRGRRLGRLVTEPLPVIVRAAETTRGRGRLYRRSRVYGHAAAALRAGTASRAAARVGLPRTAGAHAVIDALAAATGRRTDDVAALLYGPPPTDDAGLELLARRLDDLESEVHHL
ncbi:DUF4350 domain-containing protein [Pengzhenrongella sicca]|uniref:DUF4350 domain-containing protein n=1 Tax=Pengzhenrongella sicca TaxID=2819238 RepID=A0A8A4ZH02_9MICO|nr:DUF4350 domain-containing protein [Pengzhenrongella sicca]